VYFNGQRRNADFFRNSAYVRQEDIHIPTLTVMETLRFAARLRVAEGYTSEEREARVVAVMDLLGLLPCKDSLVGDGTIRGISGGQVRWLGFITEGT